MPETLPVDAFLRLRQGLSDEALHAFATAVAHIATETPLLEAYDRLSHQAGANDTEMGCAWARILLALGVAARFPSDEARARLRSHGSQPLEALPRPIVIVAGATVGLREADGQLIRSAAWDFTGTLISGGTTSGVCGLVGELGAASSGRIRTLGYVPAAWPGSAQVDARYDEVRRTNGADFSPQEPLQAWADVLGSGIDPAGVSLVGIGGGEISAMEFRVALALGARVGILAGSGREADRLLVDPRWQMARLVSLAPAATALEAFLHDVPDN